MVSALGNVVIQVLKESDACSLVHFLVALGGEGFPAARNVGRQPGEHEH